MKLDLQHNKTSEFSSAAVSLSQTVTMKFTLRIFMIRNTADDVPVVWSDKQLQSLREVEVEEKLNMSMEVSIRTQT